MNVSILRLSNIIIVHSVDTDLRVRNSIHVIDVSVLRNSQDPTVTNHVITTGYPFI